MPLINSASPITIYVVLVLFILIVYLARNMKRSNVTCIMLLVFLSMIIGHSIEYALLNSNTNEVAIAITKSIAMDFVYILLAFIAYLWTDHIESKEKKIKSVDNGLDWFWEKRV